MPVGPQKTDCSPNGDELFVKKCQLPMFVAGLYKTLHWLTKSLRPPSQIWRIRVGTQKAARWDRAGQAPCLSMFKRQSGKSDLLKE